MKARIFILGLLFAVFCTVSSSYADVPQMINYHGQLTTPEGDLIDTTVSMTFAVYADSVGGDPLWSETQESVQVEKGVFSVLLGSVSAIPAEAFESGLRYLGVKVGLDPEMTPRSQIASVGYAFRSQRADTAEYALGGAGKQGNGWVDDGWVVRLEDGRDRVGIGTINPSAELHVHGRRGIMRFTNGVTGIDWDDGLQIGQTGVVFANADIWNWENGFLRFATNNTERMRITADGNVGIGTATPARELTVQGDILQTNANGEDLCLVTPTIPEGRGSIETFDPATGRGLCLMSAAQDGCGAFGTFGTNGELNVFIANQPGNANNGSILTCNEDGDYRAGMSVEDNRGVVFTADPNGNERAQMSVCEHGSGAIQMIGANGSNNITLDHLTTDANHGAIYVCDGNGEGLARAGMLVGSQGNGFISTWGRDGSPNVRLTTLAANINYGYVAVYGPSEAWRAGIFAHSEGSGNSTMLGSNGHSNVRLTHLADFASNGYVAVYGAAGDLQTGMFVRADGLGEVFADVKGFRLENPNQPGTEICYACPEGPEAAAYTRGTGHLVNGRAEVTFPEHFKTVISPEGITVQLTPLSAESKGLAVVEKSPDRLVVRELGNGDGTYDFDYMVMAVRKGHEDYQVIRSALQMQPAEAEAEAIPR